MSYLVSPQYGSQLSARTVPSMYETLEPAGFSTELKTHFVEWFSGDALDSIWTFVNVSGVGSGAMNDAENGGFRITTDSVGNGRSSAITFNNIRHYSNTGSVCVAVTQQTSTASTFQYVGLSELSGDNTYAIHEQDSLRGGNQNLTTELNVTATRVDTGLAMTTNQIKSRVELRSVSCILHVNDDLVAVSTSNLPDVKLQAYCRQGMRTGGGSKTGDIHYLEAFNT